jgi:hypothetical protein
VNARGAGKQSHEELPHSGSGNKIQTRRPPKSLIGRGSSLETFQYLLSKESYGKVAFPQNKRFYSMKPRAYQIGVNSITI